MEWQNQLGTQTVCTASSRNVSILDLLLLCWVGLNCTGVFGLVLSIHAAPGSNRLHSEAKMPPPSRSVLPGFFLGLPSAKHWVALILFSLCDQRRSQPEVVCIASGPSVNTSMATVWKLIGNISGGFFWCSLSSIKPKYACTTFKNIFLLSPKRLLSSKIPSLTNLEKMLQALIPWKQTNENPNPTPSPPKKTQTNWLKKHKKPKTLNKLEKQKFC